MFSGFKFVLCAATSTSALHLKPETSKNVSKNKGSSDARMEKPSPFMENLLKNTLRGSGQQQQSKPPAKKKTAADKERDAFDYLVDMYLNPKPSKPSADQKTRETYEQGLSSVVLSAVAVSPREQHPSTTHGMPEDEGAELISEQMRRLENRIGINTNIFPRYAGIQRDEYLKYCMC